MTWFTGLVLLAVGLWLYRKGVQWERRHGRNRH